MAHRVNQVLTSPLKTMDSPLFRYEFAVIAIICIVSIFLFPIPVGPYPAVHGPATALQALHAAVKLRWLIVVAALASSPFAGKSAHRLLAPRVDFSLASPSTFACSILRC